MNSWCTLLNAFCFVCGTCDPIPHEKQSRTFVNMLHSLKKGFSNFFCYLCCWNTRAKDVDHCTHKWDPTQKVAHGNKKLLLLQFINSMNEPNTVSRMNIYVLKYRIPMSYLSKVAHIISSTTLFLIASSLFYCLYSMFLGLFIFQFN